MKKGTPQNPNQFRVIRARVALKPYVQTSGELRINETVMIDLLTDLMHYASNSAAVTIDFDEALRVARDHYDTEGLLCQSCKRETAATRRLCHTCASLTEAERQGAK